MCDLTREPPMIFRRVFCVIQSCLPCAVCCSVLQRVAACHTSATHLSYIGDTHPRHTSVFRVHDQRQTCMCGMTREHPMLCSVLQCVAACCSVPHIRHTSVIHRGHTSETHVCLPCARSETNLHVRHDSRTSNVVQCVAACCSMLLCVETHICVPCV